MKIMRTYNYRCLTQSSVHESTQVGACSTKWVFSGKKAVYVPKLRVGCNCRKFSLIFQVGHINQIDGYLKMAKG